MARFDHNAPFGTCHGSETNAAFYQKGNHFDVNHNHIDLATGKIIEPAAGTPLKRKNVNAAAAPAPAPVTPPVTEEPEEDEGDGEGDNVDNVGGDNAGSGEAKAPAEVSAGIDLVAFAKGEGKYQWFSVKAAMLGAGYTEADVVNSASARAAIKAKNGLE